MTSRGFFPGRPAPPEQQDEDEDGAVFGRATQPFGQPRRPIAAPTKPAVDGSAAELAAARAEIARLKKKVDRLTSALRAVGENASRLVGAMEED